MVCSSLWKRYGSNLQNDTKLETTSCFIAEEMALDETLQEVCGNRVSGVNPEIKIRLRNDQDLPNAFTSRTN